ncbi:MAG: hypothetical protein ACKVRP_02445 [Bacteroidota bacterium]
MKVKVKIEIHSITVRATIVDAENPARNRAYQATFTPDMPALPGQIEGMFRAAQRHIFYNEVDKPTVPASQTKETPKTP